MASSATACAARRGVSTPAGARRRPWLARLRSALDERRFVLHYQPIVSLRDGVVAHHEALVRLVDPAAGGLVSPASFLPAAERHGLVREIDRMVLAEALAALARRRESAREGAALTTAETVGVAVNLSALSVTDASLLGFVRACLERHGLDGGALVLEVTETASISDMARARAFCEGVRALGCAVALDDFGAGFGSFAYLKHLPFDYLKIDGAFVHALARTRSDQVVVSALVQLARGFGARSIAEYVGDEPTLELLRDLGVDYAQGYALGRPRPLADAGAESILARAPLWERRAQAAPRAG